MLLIKDVAECVSLAANLPQPAVIALQHRGDMEGLCQPASVPAVGCLTVSERPAKHFRAVYGGIKTLPLQTSVVSVIKVYGCLKVP